MSSREYHGKGWKFPIRVNARGGLSYVGGEQDVAEAIWIILATAKGERQMVPGFGCGIHDYVFAPNNPATRGAIAYQVRQALVDWEARIDVMDVTVQTHPESENTLLIRVDYRIRSNNAFYNLVYPFYIREGEGA
jgi:phage baseplate assembly protein W